MPDYKDKIVNLQHKFNRTEDESVDQLLKEWRGNEERLYDMLKNKYEMDEYIERLEYMVFTDQLLYLREIPKWQLKGLEDYVNFGHVYTNWLRSGIIIEKYSVRDMRRIKRALEKTFDEIPPIKEPLLVYRGINRIDPTILGSEFDFENVLSVTLDPNSEFTRMEYVYTIRIKPGNKLIPLYVLYRHDYELLLSTKHSHFDCSYRMKKIDCVVTRR